MAPARTELELRTVLAICVFAVLVVNALLLVLFGLRTGGDAPRYLDGAQRVLAGEPLSDRQQVYFGYIYLLAWLQRAGALPLVYAVHVAGAVAGTVAAVYLGSQFGGSRVALTTGLLWAAFYDIHKWNFYILTDALFISSVMVASAMVMRARIRGLAWAVIGLLVMATLRFNGVVFAAVFIVYLFVVRKELGARAALLATLITIALMPSAAPVTSLHPAPTEGRAPVQSGTLSFLTEGHVIWETVKIPMPPQMNSTGRLAPDLVHYATAHPIAVVHLYWLRFLHYAWAYNPFFSGRHILVTTGLMTLLYCLAIAGFLTVAGTDGQLAWLAGLWVCQAAIVVLTVGDYDGRYSLYAVPALLPFVAVGLTTGVSWIRRRHPPHAAV